MGLLGNARQKLKAWAQSDSTVARGAYSAYRHGREVARLTGAFVTNGQYRATVLAQLFRPGRVHQTTVVTWMDRYPEIFAACRDHFGATRQISILSFGCSTGEEVITLRTYFPNARIIGADINARNLAICRSRQVDKGISFIESEPKAIAASGPYDAIFCMAVLQRTPHLVKDKGITDLSSIYPFDKFDRQVAELDQWLKRDGLLIIRHAHYRLGDAAAGARYAPLPSAARLTEVDIKFGPDSQRIGTDVATPNIFMKMKV